MGDTGKPLTVRERCHRAAIIIRKAFAAYGLHGVAVVLHPEADGADSVSVAANTDAGTDVLEVVRQSVNALKRAGVGIAEDDLRQAQPRSQLN